MHDTAYIKNTYSTPSKCCIKHVPSKKPLSTKIADRCAHARSYHHTWKVSVTASRAWQNAHIWGKQICLKIHQLQSNAKWLQSLLLPPDQVALLTQKNFKGFFNISGQLGEVLPLKILSAARSFNLSGPPKTWSIGGPCHLYRTHLFSVISSTRTCFAD